jgi:hypothetical protein
MFNPSREQVRQFFCEAWRKYRERAILEGAEVTAADLILHHPEYHALLENPALALEQEFTPESGQMNPFLHLSLHLAIAEQISIDQPPGIRAAYQALRTRLYVATDDLMMAVNAAITLQRPLLIKGEPGTGKTVLAEESPRARLPLIEWHIKSTTKAQQGLYEYDAVSRLRDSQLGDERGPGHPNYIVPASCGRRSTATRAGAADRRDRQGRHRVPERPAARTRPHGVLRLRDAADDEGAHRPIVIITSNNEKELPDAFLRRCFFHYIRFPDRETMTRSSTCTTRA